MNNSSANIVFDSINLREWDGLIKDYLSTTIFHTSSWIRVLTETYRYKPFYLSISTGNSLKTCIPLLEIDSIITGKRVVSLPFTDYCEPLTNDLQNIGDLFEYLKERGKKAGWKYIELRTGMALPVEYTPASIYHGHVLNLELSEEELYTNLRDTTRRNIQKARKEGVVITAGTSEEAIREFYQLNCLTRRDHGLPPQPYMFFHKIFEHVLSRNLGQVLLASKKGKNIAGAVFFHFNKKVSYKYGASDKRYQHLRANNLIMWDAIRTYRQNGYSDFSFGRTEPENTGLLQFKTGWGAQEIPIYYYKYDLRLQAFVKDVLNLKGFHNRIFSLMPMPILKIAGSMLYRHMG